MAFIKSNLSPVSSWSAIIRYINVIYRYLPIEVNDPEIRHVYLCLVTELDRTDGYQLIIATTKSIDNA